MWWMAQIRTRLARSTPCGRSWATSALPRSRSSSINKVDRAAAESLSRLRASYPDAVFVSARTGEGMDQLRATIESLLPRPEIEIRALIPYERGDLVNSITDRRVPQHRTSGHRHPGRRPVSPALAGELAPYELVSSDSARRER